MNLLPISMFMLHSEHTTIVGSSILSAITRKYFGKRCVIKKDQQSLDRFTTEAIRDLSRLVDKNIFKRMGRIRLCSVLPNMFDHKQPSHPLLQSYFIMLWVKVDIHYAMNYILSAFCTAFDEVAVVTLLKQLTAFSSSDGKYAEIIKAIWDAICPHIGLKNAVLNYATRNVASYSLMTLAVHHPSYDSFERLLSEAMSADQQITLVVYNSCVQRLRSIPREWVTDRHRKLVRSIWNNMMPLLVESDVTKHQRRIWISSILRTCDVYGLAYLTDRIKSYRDQNDTKAQIGYYHDDWKS